MHDGVFNQLYLRVVRQRYKAGRKVGRCTLRAAALSKPPLSLPSAASTAAVASDIPCFLLWVKKKKNMTQKRRVKLFYREDENPSRDASANTLFRMICFPGHRRTNNSVWDNYHDSIKTNNGWCCGVFFSRQPNVPHQVYTRCAIRWEQKSQYSTMIYNITTTLSCLVHDTTWEVQRNRSVLYLHPSRQDAHTA